MKIKKILLMTVPYSIEERYGKKMKSLGVSLLPPLGLCYIATILEKKYNVKILDTNVLNISIKDVQNFLSKESFDIIGLTFMTPMYSNFQKLLKSIKPLSKNAKIIAGGPHPSIFPSETMKENPELDFVIFGEGESIMPDLMNALEKGIDLRKVKGIAFREKNKIIQNPRAEMIKDLDTLPFPALHLLPIKKYIPAPTSFKRLPALHILASRGCPYQCTYCSSQSIFGNKYRRYSVLRTIGEMEVLMNQYSAKEIFFLDDLFTMDKKWVKELCNKIINKGYHKKLVWSCNSRVNLVDPDTLKLMKKAGCWMIHFGIESGSQRLLNLIKKGITLQQSENAIKWCKKAGIMTRAYFILGLPTETREESLATINFAKKIDPDFAKFSLLTPYPGTELFEAVKKEGNLKSTQWETYKTMGGFGGTTERPYVPKGRTSREINDIQKKAHKDFYFRPKIILRLLKGCTTLDEIKMYIRSALALFNL